MSIRVPAGPVTQAVRAQYVSLATQGVAVTVWAVGSGQPATPSVVAGLTSGAGSCSAITAGAFTCTLAIPSPIGSDNFLVTTYDQAPAAGIPQGNVLSTNTLQATIVQNAANLLQLALDGQPATVTVTPLSAAVPLGYLANVSLTVMAKDADGNIIIGPGSYTAPIVLTIGNDPNQTLSLGTSSFASPATTSVTLSYDGGTIPGVATITASTTGAPSAVLLLQAIQGVAVPIGVPTANPIL